MTVYLAVNEIDYDPINPVLSVVTTSNVLRTGVRACMRLINNQTSSIALKDRNFVDGNQVSLFSEGWIHVRTVTYSATWGANQIVFGFTNGTTTQNACYFTTRQVSFSVHELGSYFGPVDGNFSQTNTIGLNVSSTTDVLELDIHFKIHATEGFVRWYVNGDLKRSISGNTLFSEGDQEAKIVALGWITSSSNIATDFAELLISDEPTLNAKVLTVPLDAFDSNVNDWEGDLSDVNGTSFTIDAISSDTVGDQFLASLDTVVGFDSELAVTGLVLSSAALKDPDSAVTSLAPLLKTGGTLYDSFTQMPLSEIIGRRQYVFSLNPDTSAAWTESDVNSLLVGYESGDD